jgi:hypothetical protein
MQKDFLNFWNHLPLESMWCYLFIVSSFFNPLLIFIHSQEVLHFSIYIKITGWPSSDTGLLLVGMWFCTFLARFFFLTFLDWCAFRMYVICPFVPRLFTYFNSWNGSFLESMKFIHSLQDHLLIILWNWSFQRVWV